MTLKRCATTSLCGFFLLSTSVCAQERLPCHRDAGHLIAEIEKRGQQVSALGINHHGHLVRLLNDPEDGAWSIVVSLPDGAGCVVSAGFGWDRLEGGS